MPASLPAQARRAADATIGGTMPKRKTDTATAPPDPDKLVRQAAGEYRTADGRFEVREAAGEWFLVDSEQSNEFGQELIHGPYPTLKALRAAVPGAREGSGRPKPLRAPSKRATAEREPAPEPPRTWIDELPAEEQAAVRRLIATVEDEGAADAEALVRRDREGLMPAVASALIAARLDRIVGEVAPKRRDEARELVARAVSVLTADGTRTPEGLPGWALVEIGPEPMPRNRRINLGD